MNLAKKLLLFGDMGTNPGPAVESCNDTLNNLRKKKQNLKVLQINVLSISQQRLQLKKILHDLGPNTITAITETWLNDTDEKTLWQLLDQFQFLRSLRRKPSKLKVGGMMLIVPALFNMKTRKDHAKSFKENEMKNIWIELNTKNRKNYIVEDIYNPLNKHTNNFLESLNLAINRCITEN